MHLHCKQTAKDMDPKCAISMWMRPQSQTKDTALRIRGGEAESFRQDCRDTGLLHMRNYIRLFLFFCMDLNCVALWVCFAVCRFRGKEIYCIVYDVYSGRAKLHICCVPVYLSILHIHSWMNWSAPNGSEAATHTSLIQLSTPTQIHCLYAPSLSSVFAINLFTSMKKKSFVCYVFCFCGLFSKAQYAVKILQKLHMV